MEGDSNWGGWWMGWGGFWGVYTQLLILWWGDNRIFLLNFASKWILYEDWRY